MSTVVLVAALVGLGSAPGLAQENERPVPESASSGAGDGELPLEIVEAYRGFDGFVFSPSVEFVTVVVHNRGTESVRGEIWVEARGLAGVRRPFEVPEQTKLPLRLDYTGKTSWPGGIRVVLEADGRRTQSWELNLSRLVVQRSGVPQRSFLLVGQKRSVPRRWIEVALQDDPEHFVVCPPLALPEEPVLYLGASAVFIGPQESHSWSRGQQRALYEYVRLGGVVVFYDDLARTGLAETRLWEDLLEVERTHRLDVDDGFIHCEALVEGRNVHHIQDASGNDVPILNVRRVGAGAVGHLGFAPDAPRLPSKLQDSKPFWTELDQAFPKSLFPLVQGGYWGDSHILDLTSLYLLIAYLLLYTLGFTSTLIFFCRRRTGRWRLWAVAAGTPLLFLAAVPLVNGLFHVRPSYGELREVVFFGPGSTHGLVSAHLGVRSSGRQRHGVEIAGLRPSGFPLGRDHSSRFYYGSYWGRSYNSLLAGAGSSMLFDSPTAEVAPVSFQTAPWSRYSMAIAATARLEAPIEAKAVLDRGAKTLEYEVRLPSRPDGGRFLLVAVGLDPDRYFYSYPVDARADENGAIRGRVSTSGTAAASAGQRRRGTPGDGPQPWSFSVGGNFTFLPNPTVSERVLLAWVPGEADPEGVTLRSDDVKVEREASEYLYRERRRRFGDDLFFERDGRYFRRLHHRLMVIELSLEMR